MDAPVNTWMYFIAGYSVILGSLLLYIVSLAVRWRYLLKQMKQNHPDKP